MIFTTLMVASLLSVSDPSGDAVGTGQVSVPKAAIFRELANFDILNLSIEDQSTFAFEISMASLENPWELPLGFSLPIIEVYVAIDPVRRNSSRNELLPGSGMKIRNGNKWNYAFRITGNAIDVYTIEDGVVKEIADDVELNYTISDNRIYIETNIRLAGDVSVYSMLGSYDPFSETGWRAVGGLGTERQPWMLSSDTQTSPVLDVVVDDFSMQQRSIQAGVLPEITAAARQPSWLWVVVAGLLTCLLALISRPRKNVKQTELVESGLDSETSTINLDDGILADDGYLANNSVLADNDLEVGNTEAELDIGIIQPNPNEKIHDTGTEVEQQVDSDVDPIVQPNVFSTTEKQKHKPIQWTSWDEGETGSEDTMIEFDRIASEEANRKVGARATQPSSPEPHPLNVKILESQDEEQKQLTELTDQKEQIQQTNRIKEFQENLLPEVEDESLLSNKQPPKGFTKRMKQFGLEEVQSDDLDSSLDGEDLT